MNSSILARDDVRFMGISAVMLTATLAAMLAIFALAKPSGAQEAPPLTLTVDPTRVDFGTVVTDDRVVGSVVTRQITITNQGSTPITIGGVNLTADAGEILDFTTNIGPDGLTVAGNGGQQTFEVSFDPSAVGARDAVLELLDDSSGDVIGLLDPNGNPLVDDLGNTINGVVLTGTGVAPSPTPAANCTIVGTNDGETLRGTPGRDVICALGGRDTIKPLGGNDKVIGGRGNDVVRSSAGRDTLNGGIGADRLTDKAGRRGDRLYGKSGKDTLNAKDGRRGDLLNGGPRRDRAFKDKGDITKRI
jgi:Ca2+-binding RTX toxin-like protein